MNENENDDELQWRVDDGTTRLHHLHAGATDNYYLQTERAVGTISETNDECDLDDLISIRLYRSTLVVMNK